MNQRKTTHVKYLRGMTFLQFLTIFGMFWDQEKYKYTKWFPWPKQAQLCGLFESKKYNWVMKARQLGISELMALYAIFVALREPKSEIIIISKKLPDAKYFIKKRVKTKLEPMRELEQELGMRFSWMDWTILEGRIDFENGSWIEAASSDNEEVRSHTPRLILFDEVRSFARNDAKELWSAMKPAIREQPRSQLIAVSTPRPGTWFNETTKSIIAKDMKDIQYFFMPANSHPKRTAEWYAKESANEPDKKLFYREYPRNTEDCFAAREGMVFKSFDRKIHVRDVQLDFRNKYILCYDHGRQHPACMLYTLYDRYTDHLYVFDEVFLAGYELPEICYQIKGTLNLYQKAYNAPTPQKVIADSACFAKDGRKPVAATLRQLTGLNFTKAGKKDQKGTLDALCTRFFNGGITIDPRCVNTIKQVENLRWKHEYNKDENEHEEHKEIPMDIDNDSTDCIIYLEDFLRGTPKPILDKTPQLMRDSVLNVKRARIKSRYTGVTDIGNYGSTEEFTQDQLRAWEGL